MTALHRINNDPTLMFCPPYNTVNHDEFEPTDDDNPKPDDDEQDDEMSTK